MNKNLNRFEQSSRIVVGSILLFLSFAVFVHPVARLLIILCGLWIILEGALGCCPLYSSLGMKKPNTHNQPTVLLIMIAGIQAVLGYVWWHAGWVKVWNGEFIASLPQVMTYYASNNPFWFAHNFMLNQATRYYGLFGGLVQMTQYIIGLGLLALAYVILVARRDESRRSALYFSIVGCSLGAIMNAVFYFTIGYSNEWVASGNVVMFWIQLILVYGYINLLMAKGAVK